MKAAREPRTEEIVETLVDIIREKLPSESQTLTEEFVARYFTGVAPEDLDESDAANLYGAEV